MSESTNEPSIGRALIFIGKIIIGLVLLKIVIALALFAAIYFTVTP